VLHRKLLVLTYHFPPSAASGSFRLLGFARHLPRLDWQVSVVAPSRLPWEPVDDRLLEQLPREIAVHNVAYPQSRASKVIRWLALNGAWLPGAFAAVRRLIRERRPDVVLTSGPPQCVHLLGLYLKRFHGLPWIADFRDPWVVGDRQESQRSLRVWCARRCERAILRHAHLVVSNAPQACAHLQAGYPEHQDKIVVITNGYEPGGFPDHELRPAHGDDIRIVHTGELYYGRDPRPFLDALCEMRLAAGKGSQTMCVRFLGRTTVGDFNLKAEVTKRGLDQVVELGGQVSYDESLRAMEDADVLLLLDNPGRRVGVPAKLYEYLGAGAAILALAEKDGDTAWVLRQSGVLHRLAPPGNPTRIRQALTELAACLASGQAVYPDPGRLFAFTREATARALAEHLDALVPARAGTAAPVVPALAGSSH
jgi:glycosyltransferase involved in cell wall biosynthesis